MLESGKIDPVRRPQSQHQRFEGEIRLCQLLAFLDWPLPGFDPFLIRAELALVPPAVGAGERVGRGAEAEIGDVPPIFLIVPRTVLGRTGEVRDLVGGIAVIAEELVSEEEDVPLRLFGQLAHLPLGEPEPERGALVKGELITGDVIRPERDRLLQSPLPDLERLSRQAVD